MDTIEQGAGQTRLPELKRNAATRDILAHAARQARERNLDDYLIVDVDAHHFENQSWGEIVEYIPDPVIRDIASNFRSGGDGRGDVNTGIMQASGWPLHQSVGGRIPHEPGCWSPASPASSAMSAWSAAPSRASASTTR